MAGRDEAEFEAYVASDGGRLLGFALLLAGNYQDAEDLVQTALLRSAGRWATARENPPAYTRTVLVNLARDRWRARRRRHRETLIADIARLPVAAARDGAAATGSRAMSAIRVSRCRWRRARHRSRARFTRTVRVYAGGFCRAAAHRPAERSSAVCTRSSASW